MKIIPLKEGNFVASPTKDFSILTTAKIDLAQGIKMAVQPFLIITKNDYILLDSGLGWKNQTGKMVILDILEKENISRHQITKVLLSHLHKDHIEGAIRHLETGFEATFPNADLYIQKRELEYARENTGNPSFDFDTLDKLVQLPNIVWMSDDKGSITNEISYQVVGGHTPFMQVFWITEDGQTAFYGADDLPQEAYLHYHLAYKSDFDGRKAMELRQDWQKQAEEKHWNILLYHDLDKTAIQF
ncbi:MBL fold metallo-hydrolase [Chryseobacterium sp. PTM-20240506]|uniref:MBL fold metallo-hydrolase n=1 Tax=Chryseobacterium sp. PTM-20240506 TaxID=3400631 RepID=UPI003AAAE3E0